MTRNPSGKHYLHWYIDNFSTAFQNVEVLESPIYTVDDKDDSLHYTDWCLLLRKYGKNSEYLCLQLRREDDLCNDVQIPIKFSILIRATDSSLQLRRVCVKAFFQKGSCIGFDRFMPITMLLEKKSIYLPGDKLVLSCKLKRIPGNNCVFGTSEKHVGGIFSLRLLNLCPFYNFREARVGVDVKGQPLLVCHVRKIIDSKYRLLIKIEKHDPRLDSCNLVCFVYVLDSFDCEVVLQEIKHYFCKESDSITEHLLVEGNELNSHVKDNTLLLKFAFFVTSVKTLQSLEDKTALEIENRVDNCSKNAVKKVSGVYVIENESVNQSEHVENGFESKAERAGDSIKKDSDDENEQDRTVEQLLTNLRTNIFRHVYINSMFCDVVLKAGDKEVKCHQHILREKSEILKTKLENAKKSSCFRVVLHIDDIEGDILQKMVDFMYFDKIRGMDCLTCLKLLVAGDIYKVRNLKNDCGDYMSTHFSFITIYKEMYRNSIFCDVHVRSANLVVECHRVILCMGSEVLRRRLLSAKPRSDGIVILDIDDVDDNTLVNMIDYLYCIEIIDMDHESLLNLYEASDIFKIESLKERCSRLLKSSFTNENVFNILVAASELDDDNLRCSACIYIGRHFSELKGLWNSFKKEEKCLAAEIERIIKIVTWSG